MVKPNPMVCGICDLKVVRPVHTSWEDYGICPKCFGMKLCEFIPAYDEGAPLMRPVSAIDRYLHAYTNRALGRGELGLYK